MKNGLKVTKSVALLAFSCHFETLIKRISLLFKHRFNHQSVKSDRSDTYQSFGLKNRNDIVYITIGILLYNYIYSYTIYYYYLISITKLRLMALLSLLTLCPKINL